LLWTFVGDGALNHPAVSAAGYVYVSSGTNTYAVALDSGLQAWTVDRGGWLSLAAGHLYIASSDGSVAAYQLTMH
jgi:outer membrane protein assembly factor BamB